MSAILFKHIKELLQVRDAPPDYVAGKEMSRLPTLKDAFLLVEDGVIADFGAMDRCPQDPAHVVNADQRIMLPSWCDSHTHLVYAGNRENEFIDRIKGMTYEQIAQRGGGIIHSACTLQKTSEEELYQQSRSRLEEVIQMGTGALEIKSGYGLSHEAELKMLRVIQRLKRRYPIAIKATFLGAHAVPPSYRGNSRQYIDALIEKTLPVVAQQSLAEFVDVFCEPGYFSLADAERMMRAGNAYGLKPKIHVNQFNAVGGVALAVRHDALSVDHLEVMQPEDYRALKGSATMPVALPGCSYFLGLPYTPARDIIDRGLPLALATDYNPGSAPSGNMHHAVSAACIKMKMTPEEALNAATLNGAYAMGLSRQMGSISKGKKAHLIMTRPIPSYAFLPYAFSSPYIEKVYVGGVAYP